MKRACDECGAIYKVDKRNFNPGWDRCCSKSCAAFKRERDKYRILDSPLQQQGRYLRAENEKKEKQKAHEHLGSVDGLKFDQGKI